MVKNKEKNRTEMRLRFAKPKKIKQPKEKARNQK